MNQLPSEFADVRQIEPHVGGLLREAGMASAFSLEPLRGGRNNRTYRIIAGGESALLKWYFSHPQDRRDRLHTEYSFCRFCWDHGIRRPPRPLARDNQNNLALYEFIAGRALRADEISGDQIRAAIDFQNGLDRHKSGPDAAALQIASEACFSISEHLQRVDRRVQRLSRIEATTDAHGEAMSWVRDRLQPTWKHTRGEVMKRARRANIDAEAVLATSDRCLSPSDFGFHNAIVTGDGSLRFIDFEYAGWDDPAKLICDFFCQVEIPVPREYFTEFADGITATSGRPHHARRRAKLLMPVYQLKWCCITMNEFLPTGGARRRFGDTPSPDSPHRQPLKIAQRLLDEAIDISDNA